MVAQYVKAAIHMELDEARVDGHAIADNFEALRTKVVVVDVELFDVVGNHAKEDLCVVELEANISQNQLDVKQRKVDDDRTHQLLQALVAEWVVREVEDLPS